jgi:hypothetical protein
MALLAHLIGFGDPGGDFIVDLVLVREAEGVQMITRRKRFDSAKTRIRQASRQDDVAVDPVFPDREGCETHSDLESDPRLFRQNGDRAVCLCEGEQFVEDRANFFRFAFEMRREGIGPMTGVRLISIRELAAAFRAAPQWWIGRSEGRLLPSLPNRHVNIERRSARST